MLGFPQPWFVLQQTVNLDQKGKGSFQRGEPPRERSMLEPLPSVPTPTILLVGQIQHDRSI